jgi:hypothetical protein
MKAVSRLPVYVSSTIKASFGASYAKLLGSVACHDYKIILPGKINIDILCNIVIKIEAKL